MNENSFETRIDKIKDLAMDIRSYAHTASRMREINKMTMVDTYIDALLESCSEMNGIIVSLKEIRK